MDDARPREWAEKITAFFRGRGPHLFTCDGERLVTDEEFTIELLTDFAKEVREEDARVAEQCWHGPGDHGCPHGYHIAAAIRARGKGGEG